MKKQIMLAVTFLFVCSINGYAQVPHKTLSEKNPKGLNSSIADSMRRVGMGIDSNVDLMYNKNAGAIDSVPQEEHNQNMRRKRANRKADPMNKK